MGVAVCSGGYVSFDYKSGCNLYFCRFQSDGDVFVTNGASDEEWGTSAPADYAVSMVEEDGSGHYIGQFDSEDNIPSGDYPVCVYVQQGASPYNGDSIVANGLYQKYSSATLTLRAALVIILAAIAVLSALVPTTEEIRQEIDANSVQIAAIVEDTNELQTDWTDGGRLDVILDAVKKYTDLIVIVETDVNDANEAGSFTVTDGNSTADFYNDYLVMVQDANDSQWEVRIIEDWGTDLQVETENDFNFTPQSGDLVYIMGWQYIGNIWEKVQSLGMVLNIIDETGDKRTGAGMGLTSFSVEGDDP
jgi:hypothetical protein